MQRRRCLHSPAGRLHRSDFSLRPGRRRTRKRANLAPQKLPALKAHRREFHLVTMRMPVSGTVARVRCRREVQTRARAAQRLSIRPQNSCELHFSSFSTECLVVPRSLRVQNMATRINLRVVSNTTRGFENCRFWITLEPEGLKFT
jgi:hypothetical protein